MEPYQVAPGRWGVLQVADFLHLALHKPDNGIALIESGSLLKEGTGLAGWVDDEAAIAFLAATTGHVIARLDIAALRLTEVAMIERESDRGMRFIYFVDHDDLVVGIHDSGVICVERSGHVLWNVHHENLGVELFGFRNGVVWFEYQRPDGLAGQRFGFRLNDGQCVDDQAWGT